MPDGSAGSVSAGRTAPGSDQQPPGDSRRPAGSISATSSPARWRPNRSASSWRLARVWARVVFELPVLLPEEHFVPIELLRGRPNPHSPHRLRSPPLQSASPEPAASAMLSTTASPPDPGMPSTPGPARRSARGLRRQLSQRGRLAPAAGGVARPPRQPLPPLRHPAGLVREPAGAGLACWRAAAATAIAAIAPRYPLVEMLCAGLWVAMLFARPAGMGPAPAPGC